MGSPLTKIEYSVTCSHCAFRPLHILGRKVSHSESVAYPGIFFRGAGVQQIQLRTERTGIWGRQPLSQGFWRHL